MGRKNEYGAAGSGEKGRAAILAVLIWLALSLNLKDPGQSQIGLNFIASFRSPDLLWVLMLPALFFLLYRAGEVPKRGRRRISLIPACFLALNMVLGFAFAEEDSWDMLLGLQNGQLIKALLVWAAWSVLLDHLLRRLFTLLDRADVSEYRGPDPESQGGFHPLRRYQRALRKHPFGVSFFTLFLLYLPHFLIAYPAMFMGDTWCIVVQGYSELEMTGVDYLSPQSVLRAGVYINQHHSVLYTLLLHGFLRLGSRVFHSLNTGIFLFCLLQSAVMLASFAYAISALSRRRVSGLCLMGVIVYVILHPQIRNFLFLVTKDGLYAACFVLLMTAVFKWRTGIAGRRDGLMLVLSAAGGVLLRKEGIFVLLTAGLLTAWMDRMNRKRILCFAAVMLAFVLGIDHGLYPFLGYTKGGIQEALSVPFQQTARVLRDHPEDVSAEEKEAINAVLEYDQLAKNYNPDVADPVKGLFRQDAVRTNLIRYFRVWARMLMRHPDTYIQATYNNYYQYLYPGDTRINYNKYGWSAWMCEYTNNKIEALGKNFSLPEWNKKGRYICDSLVDAGILNVPPFSLMMTPAVYSWTIIALLCWVLGKPKGRYRQEKLILLMPYLMTWLVMFIGPTNGFYSRYMLSLTAFLPILILMLLSEPATGKEGIERQAYSRNTEAPGQKESSPAGTGERNR